MYAQGKEGEIDSHYDALQAVLSSIPEELFHEIELEVSTAEGAATNKQRLEVLREQQELIEEEADQNKDHQEAGGEVANLKDDKDIDEKEIERRAAEESSAPAAGKKATEQPAAKSSEAAEKLKP